MSYLFPNRSFYGSMFGNEIAQVVAVAAPNVYYPVPGSLIAGAMNAFLFAASTLQCLIGSLYLINWSMSLNSPANNQDISGTVMIDANPTPFASHNFNGVGIGRNSSIAGMGIIQINAGSVIQLSVANHTAANNIVIEHANLTLSNV